MAFDFFKDDKNDQFDKSIFAYSKLDTLYREGLAIANKYNKKKTGQ